MFKCISPSSVTKTLIFILLCFSLYACERSNSSTSKQSLTTDSPGVTDQLIKIGNTAPYSGPFSPLSTVTKATAAYIEKINASGGINGRRIEFISRNDDFNPSKTLEQVRRLVEQDHVLFLFGTVGTPTNAAIQPYLNQAKVPQLFILSGSEKLVNSTKYPWTIRYPPSFYQEGILYAKHILKEYPHEKVAILYQNDDYGKDYLNGFKEGVRQASKDENEVIAAIQSYDIRTPTIDSQILILKESGASVFLNVSATKMAVQSIRKMAEIGWNPTHFLIQPAMSYELTFKPAGYDKSKGIYSYFFTKDVGDPQWKQTPEIQEYFEFMKKYLPEANPLDIYNAQGYTMGQLLEILIKACGNDLTRENVLKEAKQIDVELPLILPGIRIRTSQDRLGAISQLQLVQFDGEMLERVGDVVEIQ